MNSKAHSFRSVYFIICCLTSGLVPGLQAGPLDRWTSRSITNFSSSFSFGCLAHGNQGFVALASEPAFASSNVWTSSDGSQWNGYAIPALTGVEGITYGNGSYVAVGNVAGYPNLGLFGHSTTGTNWTLWLAPAGLRAVAYGNGKYVAVGDFGTVFTLDTQFNGTSNPPPTMDSLRGITYGAGRFVAVGDMGRVMVSTNGQTWKTNTLPFPSPSLNAIAYGNGYYVAVGMSGAIWRSSDGLNWTDYSPGAFSGFRGIGFGEGVFVTVGWNGAIYTSTDGASWIQRNSGVFMPPGFNDVAYGNGSFVAVGDFSTILQSGALNGRPEILQQPQSLTAPSGAFISFGVAANGVAPLQYQWFKNGTNVPGAINSIFSVTNVQPSDSGDYTVTVTNAFGFDSSAVATLTVETAFPLDFWHWRNPLPQGNDIVDVVYGNGRFIGATVDGTVGVSFDGYSLSGVSTLPVDFPFDFLQSLSFANGQFFAGSRSILSSPNGITWSGSNSFSSAYSVAYGNGVYVGAGYSYPAYGVIYSTDGLNWTNINANLTFDVGHLVFANGVFVAVGYSYSYPGSGIATSVDGINWTLRGHYVGRSFQSVAYGNQLFVTVGDQGDVFTSPDGIHWTLRNSNTQNSLWKITFGNDRFVAVGDGGTIITSVDGINWSLADTVAFSGYALTSVAGGGGRFVAVGEGGLILGSSDAMTWTAISSSVTSQPLYACASGDGTLVAVGYFGTVLTSVNGVSWASQNSGTLEPLNKVIHADGRFVAVGGEGAILTSTNGINWVARDSGTVAGLNGIAYGNGSYVAVGNGVVLSSSNAANWSVIREGNWMNAIAFGTNFFVAVGDNGLIISSTNLAQWQTNYATTSASLYGVTYGNDQFVAVGSGGTIIRASNPFFGTPYWSTVPQYGVFESYFDVTYGDGEFVAVGGDPYSSFSPSVIASSEDGQTWTWTNRYAPSYSPLYGVTDFGNSLITVGDYGTILQSDGFTDLSLGIQILATNDPFPTTIVQLTITGTPGFRYIIESGDSLSNPDTWFPMWPDILLTNSPQIVTLPVASPLGPQGFFRARRYTFP